MRHYQACFAAQLDALNITLDFYSMRPTLRLVILALALSPRALPAQGTALDLVKRLYAAYAWETNDAETAKHTPLFSEPAPVLARYFDAPLVRAVLQNRACQKRTGDICNLDFVPIWDSQDPGGVTVDVVPTRDSMIVQAHIHYQSDYGTRVVTYHLRKTSAGWRITDIAGAEWPSLLRLLRSP